MRKVAIFLILCLTAGACRDLGLEAGEQTDAVELAGAESKAIVPPISKALLTPTSECAPKSIKRRLVRGCVSFDAMTQNGSLDWATWLREEQSAGDCSHANISETARKLGNAVASDRIAAQQIGIARACERLASLASEGVEVYEADGIKPSLLNDVTSVSGKGEIDTTSLVPVGDIRGFGTKTMLFLDPHTLRQHGEYKSFDVVTVQRNLETRKLTFYRNREYARCSDFSHGYSPGGWQMTGLNPEFGGGMSGNEQKVRAACLETKPDFMDGNIIAPQSEN